MPAAAAVPLIAAAISAGGGVAASALANRKGANTATSASTTKQTQTSTATTKRNLTPEQSSALQMLFGQAGQLIQNPAESLNPIRQSRRNAVNADYRGVEDLIRGKYDTGPGKSGKFGRAATSVELSRLGALGGVDADISRLILDQTGRGMSLAERLVSIPLEQTSTQTTTGDGSSSGTQAGPSAGALAGGLAGAGANLSSLSALLALQRLLQGGNSYANPANLSFGDTVGLLGVA